MSIKTTQDISREDAIGRITKLVHLVGVRNYRGVSETSFEPDEDVRLFVDNLDLRCFISLEGWADTMLEETMDKPFFRYSMFDNYLVE